MNSIAKEINQLASGGILVVALNSCVWWRILLLLVILVIFSFICWHFTYKYCVLD